LVIESREPEKRAVLRAGERLFAQRPFDLVTEADIAADAGSVSPDVVVDHFGSRTGLLQAIVDRHQVPIDARRNRLIDDLVRTGAPTVRGAAEALIYPAADDLSDPHGGRDYPQICARLRHEPDLSTMLLARSHGISRATDILIPEDSVADEVRSAKLRVVSAIMIDGLADIARDPEIDERLFVEVLIDSICAVADSASLREPGVPELAG
jgi:AcrR family transcriptional regulator